MNLEDAVKKHSEWKVKFRSAIAKKEQLDAATISKDNCCQLGVWLHGEGKSRLGGKPEFQSAVDKHRSFHLEAGKVAQLINGKQYDRADSAMGFGTPFESASSGVASALMTLKRIAG